MEKIRLRGLSSEVYEHPFDKKALASLRKLKGLDTVTNFILNWTDAKWDQVALKASGFNINGRSCPAIYEQIRETADVLEILRIPEFYTQWNYDIKADTTGTEGDILITLNSGTIDLLTPGQLDFIIGHEFGKIKSGHILYHMMAKVIMTAIGLIPLGQALLIPIQLGLLYWQKMSAFTCDRAALLACQDKEAALATIAKIAGVPEVMYDNINTEWLLEQGKRFEKDFDGLVDTTAKEMSLAFCDEPWAVYRAIELKKWIDSGEYQRILDTYGGKLCNKCKGAWVGPDAKVCHVCGLDPFS